MFQQVEMETHPVEQFLLFAAHRVRLITQHVYRRRGGWSSVTHIFFLSDYAFLISGVHHENEKTLLLIVMVSSIVILSVLSFHRGETESNFIQPGQSPALQECLEIQKWVRKQLRSTRAVRFSSCYEEADQFFLSSDAKEIFLSYMDVKKMYGDYVRQRYRITLTPSGQTKQFLMF